VAGTTEGGALLGTVLFDTDRATIRPQYDELLGKVAAWLEQRGGGSVAIVGHADPRGSDDYNAALGMRRARAVFEAIATRLSPEVRANVRVESSSDPAAPAGNSGK
jgi:outer membrane protein OmpA-like peptidoglycan-associated protein